MLTVYKSSTDKRISNSITDISNFSLTEAERIPLKKYQAKNMQGSRMSASSYYDPESQENFNSYNDIKLERTIRHGFLRKVYGIVLVQLLATFAFAFALMSNSQTTLWVQKNGFGLTLLSGIGAIIIICYLTCKEGASQSYPTNYILLGFFTFFESLSVGLLCTLFEQLIVLEAFLATALIVTGLTLFAFQTNYDFTSWVGAMFFVFFGFIAFGLIKMLFPGSSAIEIIYASCGALIFSIYLIIDTQILVGKGKIRMEEDNYILAAIMIYLDVINLFIYLLRLIAVLRRDN